MENHPIPQDVTGFKFRLIGSVTVKQFLYILGAGALCGVFFIMPISFLIKWPAILFIASLGAGLAFVPIEGRPMDVMLINFLKALPAENRYLFHKKGADALLHDFFTTQTAKKPISTAPTVSQKDSRRELLLNQLVRKNTPYKADRQEREQLQSINGMFSSSDTPVTGMSSLEKNTNIPTEAETASPVVNPEPIQADKPTEEPALSKPPVPETVAPQNPIASVPLPQPERPPLEQGAPAVVVAPENQVQSGFPQIPDTPNVVLGIVKDPRGKVLPNIIVEVVDSSNNPVRAFKTNSLGQFASATPLPVGTYQILLEDTRHVHEFSPIDIEINNEIFQPLEIISTDQREKLRQELFGANTPENSPNYSN